MSQFSVLVVGATGRQGGAVADHLLSGEYGDFDVHALTRSPESDRAQALADRGATLVEGNLLNKPSLTPAVEAVDAVYCVTIEAESGTIPTEAGIEAEIEQGTNMAEVASENGIEQFVFSSVTGAERDTGIPNFESKYDIEQRIHDLGLPATILRPVTIMQNYERQREMILNGTLASPLAEGASMQMVDVGDIGAFAATALATPDVYVGETIEVAGDEHTLESAAEVFTTVTGIDIEPQHVPIEVARKEMGEVLAMMFEWINDYGYGVDIEALERDHNIDLTQLEMYLREHDWD
ncbi:NmrA/HSCARG family protein [Haladaptatus salinisoli]|uniref:NmrA/HSCARG family protein n=1 Tax=Haladaptatus salinisoli TaxID=2884876 RepID=UPI001D0B92F8|nr:NmrA/HSCARG family protein [Haladaptatus salinisoli]